MAIQTLPSIQVRDLSGGMVSYAADILLPANTAKQSINFHFDVLGKAVQRSGTVILGTTVSAGNTCHGMAQFISNDGTRNRLVAVFNGTVFAYDGTTWTNTSGGLSTAEIRFEQFLNRLFRVGGGGVTQSWDGVTGGVFDGTNASGAPIGQYILSFKERLYIAGNPTNPDRLFFSSIASTGGTITWNTGTQFIDINPDDSNNITALSKIADLMLVFKERSMYRWNGYSTDAEIVVDLGTSSQESVARVKGLVFFFNPLGIFVTNGGYPVEISRPVADWIQNMSATFYTSVAGFGDDDHYYCFIGTITRGGRTYTNVMLSYTISSKNWSVFIFGDSYRAFARYVTTTGAVTYVGGDTGGRVQTMFSGNTDNTTPIVYEYESKEFEFESRATTKSIVEMAVFVENGAGSQLAVSEDGGSFRTFGEVEDVVNLFSGLDMRGHYFKFKLMGSNRSTPVRFDGFEFLRVNSLGYLTRT